MRWSRVALSSVDFLSYMALDSRTKLLPTHPLHQLFSQRFPLENPIPFVSMHDLGGKLIVTQRRRGWTTKG